MLQEKLATGLAAHQDGRWQEAVRIYGEILAVDPQHADAWHLLGMAVHELGDDAAAGDYIRRAIALSPEFADYHNNLSTIYAAQGEFVSAEQSCREAIRLRPHFAQAYNNLGNALLGLGQPRAALNAYEEALRIEPRYGRALANAAGARRMLGDYEAAIADCRKALALDPNSVEALNNLGHSQLAQGDIAAAEAAFRAAAAMRPTSAVLRQNLGVALQQLGRWDEAVDCYRQSIAFDPRQTSSVNSLVTALRHRGKASEAEEVLRAALLRIPHHAPWHNDLGELLWQRQEWAEAMACFRRAIEHAPRLAAAHFNLGNALCESGNLDHAISEYHLALAENPRLVDAMTNLAIAFCDQGKIAEALTWFERAYATAPGDARAGSHVLVCRQYLTGTTATQLAKWHTEWNRRHAQSLSGWSPSDAAAITTRRVSEGEARTERPSQSTRVADRSTVGWHSCAVSSGLESQPTDRSRVQFSVPSRPIRVGFVSRDFRSHPVGYFLVGLLEARDRERLHVTAYADVTTRDPLTDRIQRASDQWEDVRGLSDETLAARIAADRIDLLVDLAGHTAHHRLLVFARRPAPRQATWMGYVGTTGLAAIDFLISDRLHTPPGKEEHYCERIVRLPDGYVCYTPPTGAPSVGPLPSERTGLVTLGCFNNPAKMSDVTVAMWSHILARLSNSRLLLKYPGLDSEGARQYLMSQFAARGIDLGRIILEGGSPQNELLARYGAVDLALDTFPYSGGVTTCEALWMGVPVITLPGDIFASRHSLSHLTNAGLTGTIAQSPEHYIELAVSWASDLDQLADCRRHLRERMQSSPLCDPNRFAENWIAALERELRGEP